MGNLFNSDSPIMLFLEKAANLIILNLLWIICCIPIITIVPSTSALYYVTLKMARGEEPYIVKPFFHSFRENLKQGICLTLFYMAVGLLFFFDIRFFLSMGNALGQILAASFIVLCIVLVVMFCYTCPLQAQFYNPIRATLKNSFLLCVAHPLRTLVILVLNLIPIALFLFGTYYFLMTASFWFLLGFSLIARINAVMFVKIFAKFMPEEEVAE